MYSGNPNIRTLPVNATCEDRAFALESGELGHERASARRSSSSASERARIVLDAASAQLANPIGRASTRRIDYGLTP